MQYYTTNHLLLFIPVAFLDVTSNKHVRRTNMDGRSSKIQTSTTVTAKHCVIRKSSISGRNRTASGRKKKKLHDIVLFIYRGLLTQGAFAGVPFLALAVD